MLLAILFNNYNPNSMQAVFVDGRTPATSKQAQIVTLNDDRQLSWYHMLMDVLDTAEASYFAAGSRPDNVNNQAVVAVIEILLVQARLTGQDIELKQLWIEIPAQECRVLATQESGAIFFYVLGWAKQEKELLARSIEVDPVSFEVRRTLDFGNLIKHLAQQDARYAPAEEYANNYRVRVCNSEQFKTDRRDNSIVYSAPYLVTGEFPFFFSFRIRGGNFEPSPKFAVQKIKEPVLCVNSIEVCGDSIVYAHCQRSGLDNGYCLEGKIDFEDLPWKNNYGDKMLWNPTAFPGYDSRTNPYLFAIDGSYSKLQLVDSTTGEALSIALLYRDHPQDYIVGGSIQISSNANDDNLTVHFVTSCYEVNDKGKPISRKYYNQAVITPFDLMMFRETKGRFPTTANTIVKQTIRLRQCQSKNEKLTNEIAELKEGLTKKDHQVAELTEKLKNSTQTVSNYETRLEQQQNEIQALTAQLEAMRAAMQTK